MDNDKYQDWLTKEALYEQEFSQAAAVFGLNHHETRKRYSRYMQAREQVRIHSLPSVA